MFKIYLKDEMINFKVLKMKSIIIGKYWKDLMNVCCLEIIYVNS